MSRWGIWDPSAGHNHLANLSMIIDNIDNIIDNLQMTLLRVSLALV
jgi:hypothetical protein